MKQILKLVFLLVLGQTALAQAPSNYTNINGRYRWIAGMFDSTFHIPKGATPSLRTGGSTNAGGLFYNTADSSVYTYTGTQWIKVRGSLNPSDTTNKYVTQVYKKNASDSVFYVKGGNHIWAFNDSTGSPGGGGGGKVYYFNGGVNMGTIGGIQMYELGDTANTGAAANFTRSTTGNIANFITDPGKPGLVQIPAGVWSVDAWLSETGGGANHAEIWIEVEKWDGSTITTIATSPIEQITEGATPNLYSWSVTIPTTTLAITDRIVIQFYISNTNGKTVTLYTQNGYVGEVHTTFTTGIGAINGLTAPAQYLVTGTSGTDFNISSATATHTFNLPTASATNRGALSTTDWTTFNNKGSVSSVATNTGTGITGGTITTSGTLAIDTLLISTRAWRQKGIDSVASLVTSGYVPSSRTLTINGTTQDLSANRTYNVGTVTSVATSSATGITGGTFTTSGTIAADTLLLSTRAWRQKGIDSVASLINTRVSGTTNYIPKFTSSSAIGNSVIYESSSNIGIGTTSPATISGYTILGINNSTYGGILDIMSNGLTIGRFWTSGNAANLWTAPAVPLTFGTTDTERMRLDASGRLGLGVTPSAWGSGFRAFDFNTLGTLAASGSAVLLQNNSYNNGTNNIRKAIGEASSYSQVSGAHIWETAAFGSSGSTITFSEVMRIAASGNVGIGVSNPDSYNASAYRLVVGGLNNSGITIVGDATEGSSNLYFADGTTGDQAYRGYVTYNHSTDAMTLGTAATTRMTITSGGNVGIGVTPSVWGSNRTALQFGALGAIFSDNNLTSEIGANVYISTTPAYTYITSNYATRFTQINGQFQWHQAPSGTAGNAISFTQAMTLTAAGRLLLGTTTDGGYNVTISTGVSAAISTQNGLAFRSSVTGTTGQTDLMGIIWNDYIGNDLARILPVVDNTAANAATALRFYNHNGTSLTEKMRITSSGNVGIGTTSPSGKLHVAGDGAAANLIRLQHTGTGTNGFFDISVTSTEAQLNANYSSTAIPMTFLTGASERMRITSGGQILVGKSSTSVDVKGLRFDADGAVYMSISNADASYYLRDITNAAYRFYVNGAGTIFATNTTISAISDIRYKENVRDLDSALNKLMLLKPRVFDWKEGMGKNIKNDKGFIAQEFEQIFPELVDKWKEQAPQGEEPYKSIRQDLIPYLVKAIQELKAEIETLKNK